LADRDARTPSFGYHNPLSFPFAVAVKTGTSKDYKDNWTVGYSPRYTVGVWVGNFDGEPMQSVSGISGSGPLFKDIMLLLDKGDDETGFSAPKGVVMSDVCPLTGMRPGESCPGVVSEVFIEGTEPREKCTHHQKKSDAVLIVDERGDLPAPSRLEVTFPRNGDVFKLDPVLRREHQRIKLRAAVPRTEGIAKIEWWINGDRVGEAKSPFSLFWNLQPGSYTIKVTAVKGGSQLESPPVKVVVLT
jgi:penicillin-binding protein 1C